MRKTLVLCALINRPLTSRKVISAKFITINHNQALQIAAFQPNLVREGAGDGVLGCGRLWFDAGDPAALGPRGAAVLG